MLSNMSVSMQHVTPMHQQEHGRACSVLSVRAAAAKRRLPASCTAGLPRLSLHSCCPSHEHTSSHCALRCGPAAALFAASSNVTDFRPCADSSALSSAYKQGTLALPFLHLLLRSLAKQLH